MTQIIKAQPQSLRILEADLRRATPNTPITKLAQKLIEGAKAYDDYRTEQVILTTDYPGGITRNFNNATPYVADHVIGAPWADDADNPNKNGEFWNKGRRASLGGIHYDLDENDRPINPYLETGISERGIIGAYAPNIAVDVGIVSVGNDKFGHDTLYAYGIMKDGKPAFCGGFAEYDKKDEHGFITGREIWTPNQAKETFEEMISGSIELTEAQRREVETEFEKVIEARTKARDRKSIPDIQKAIIHAQVTTEYKLKLVEENDPTFLGRLYNFFDNSIECFTGPVRSSNRNTNTAWMETYLSWNFLNAAKWEEIKGKNPAFPYAFKAGDDADAVVPHKIDKTLLENASGTHSAMFVYMAASYLLHTQEKGESVPQTIIKQLEEVAAFLDKTPALQSPIPT